MDEGEEKARSGGRAPYLALAAANPQTNQPITFDRRELSEILAVYGRKVAAGEWRDYAIDHLREEAVFSIYRRSSEFPLYRIVKEPRLARRQGTYSLVTATGKILKRGHELSRVLRVIDRPLRLVEA
ncbi:MAG TPA: DUF2794 domain-containing protein [Bauldia sp.]|nr:DUF2794 domain-containing protein [Bauldia sp.]